MFNWVKGMIRAVASVFVTATGFALVRSDLSGAQAGLILSFAMSTSGGRSVPSSSTAVLTVFPGLFNLLEQYRFVRCDLHIRHRLT